MRRGVDWGREKEGRKRRGQSGKKSLIVSSTPLFISALLDQSLHSFLSLVCLSAHLKWVVGEWVTRNECEGQRIEWVTEWMKAVRWGGRAVAGWERRASWRTPTSPTHTPWQIIPHSHFYNILPASHPLLTIATAARSLNSPASPPTQTHNSTTGLAKYLTHPEPEHTRSSHCDIRLHYCLTHCIRFLLR